MIESRLFATEPTDKERAALRKINRALQGALLELEEEASVLACPACGGGIDKPCSCSSTGAEPLTLLG